MDQNNYLSRIFDSYGTPQKGTSLHIPLSSVKGNKPSIYTLIINIHLYFIQLNLAPTSSMSYKDVSYFMMRCLT